MVQVLPGVPNFSSRLGSALGGGIQKGADFASQIMASQQNARAVSQMAKDQEKINTIELGLDTVAQMRDLLKKGSLGKTFGINSLFSGEARKDRAMYEQMGRSLIPLVAAGVPVRNQKEFEEYKKVITDPNAFESEIEGALEGLSRLLEKTRSQKTEHPLQKGKEEKSSAEKPPLSSFYR